MKILKVISFPVYFIIFLIWIFTIDWDEYKYERNRDE